MPTQKFKTNYKVTTESQFGEALEAIDNKIEQLQKGISYLDVYNISSSIEKEEDLNSAISLLAPGEALVVNVPYPFKLGEKEYRTGDIILRLLDNKEIHIKANVGGVFYPSSLEADGNSYKLSYTYSNTQPENGTIKAEQEGDTQTISTPHKEIVFNLNANTENITNIYGIFQELSSTTKDGVHLTFPVATIRVGENDEPIKPNIKFYAVSDNTIEEEVYVSYSLTKDSSS
jgi:hypothetical protein